MRREAWPAARQRLPPDAEIGDGEVSRVMLHELEHPCPLTIISKSGLNVCFWHKADIAIVLNHVRFWGNSGHGDLVTSCPLMAQSEHGPPGFQVKRATPGRETSLCRVVVFLPRQAIEIWFVPKRAVIRFGNVECHYAVRYVGPHNGAVEPAKFVRHHAILSNRRAKMVPGGLKLGASDASKREFNTASLVIRSQRN